MANKELFSSDEIEKMIEQLISPLLVKHPRLGIVVGLLKGDASAIYGYGVCSATRLTVPDERTLFEIGSITKVFTALMLAKMVEEGYIFLDEPVCALLPECSRLPVEITLLRLVTHTSGLPRIPANLSKTFGYNPRNPYAHYTSTRLYNYLAGYRGNPDGTQVGTYAYSNLGAGLLGDVLARTLGLSYQQAIVQNICYPLGMSETRTLLTAEQKVRLASPHTSTGKRALNWTFPTLAGAGGLYSSARDMLTFLAANLGQVSTPLSTALRRCQEIVVEPQSPQSNLTSIALGWHVSQLKKTRKAMHWHNGGTGGYRSFAGFQRERQCAVVILSNYGSGPEINIDVVGVALLDQIADRSD